VYFTPKDGIFAYFSFSGVGKLILYRQDCLITTVVDTAEKFEAFWLFMTGSNDTGEKCYRQFHCHRR
jgi:hypothetical protein